MEDYKERRRKEWESKNCEENKERRKKMQEEENKRKQIQEEERRKLREEEERRMQIEEEERRKQIQSDEELARRLQEELEEESSREREPMPQTVERLVDPVQDTSPIDEEFSTSEENHQQTNANSHSLINQMRNGFGNRIGNGFGRFGGFGGFGDDFDSFFRQAMNTSFGRTRNENYRLNHFGDVFQQSSSRPSGIGGNCRNESRQREGLTTVTTKSVYGRDGRLISKETTQETL